MDTNNQITKTQLPPHQDFNFLKDEAIDYIQNHIGPEWTNFNPSDPGMTILDQVCYALTELGYCTDFSIPDILTDSTEKMEMENQFYLPYKILTTSPYTIDDYKKYIIDGIDEVYNAEITTYNDNLLPFSRVYQVYLYINPDITDSIQRDTICKSVFYYLNQSRNIGELFNMPIVLQPQNCLIGGKIEIEKDADEQAVLLELQDKLRTYIFPKIAQVNYDTLEEDGYNAAEIYDGPYLKNGWILNESILDKKDTLKTIDLIPVIESVAGIISVSGLQLYQNQNIVQALQSTINQIIFIDILASYGEKKLQLICNGKEVQTDALSPLQINLSKYQETAISLNNKPAIKLPKSSFRDINSYYSIQNTFPQQYGIGDDKIEDDSAPIQVAQSRQLKGYLTLFDQVLANQFSQLANVSKLFSFTNSVCGSPSDKDAFYALKDKYEKKHLEYPVPYKMFSPSYFYQSLYNVPHIKPLLKNNNVFEYTYGEENKKELKEKSWLEYQQDPYNAYIFGMMKIMEEEDVNFERRNSILDHLLARHGESPKVIDALIDGTIYTGNKKKDQIILKSLYLQNLDLLTYNRIKAYNFLTASKIASANNLNIKNDHYDYINENTSDFIFKSEHLNKKEKLSKTDCSNFSGFELKLNLLFGLKNIYNNFITTQFDASQSSIEDQLNANKTIQKVYWLKEKRKGNIFIETSILLSQLKYNFEITKQSNSLSYSIQNIDFQSATNINYALNTANQTVLDAQFQNGYLEFATEKYLLVSGDSQTVTTPDYTKSKLSDYAFRITVSSGNGIITINDELFKKNAILVFPDFIPELQTPEFKKRLKLFLSICLPTSIKCECLFVSVQELETLIPSYSNWHDSLRFKNTQDLFTKQENNLETANPEISSVNLINSLTSILGTKNGRNK
ncbi:hypothetical protein [Flavobacterium sharifuzzamanii]|uniref:hypothetical protein n=1 Tax=Flavobacterium sharifuzzamanii TaxID=2211133 RepID=UPI000DABB1B6|nr:hypothetical protein [Flavobacterium sharifuzzamanii]KAF2082370.1 hypothetical protein DMA14_03375 [Flavobacterium sharifuzzamanii]